MNEDFALNERDKSEVDYFITEEQYFEYYQNMNAPTFELYEFNLKPDFDKLSEWF